MSANPWYKRYPSDALVGYSMLTLEERGAYTTLLDLMYDDGEPLLDNERLRAGQMGVPLQRYKKLRNILIDKTKIYINDDDKLSNKRFDEEMKKKAELAAKRSVAGSTIKKVDEKLGKNLPKSDQLSEELSSSLNGVTDKNPNEINGNANQMIDQNDITNQIPDTRGQSKKENIYTKEFEEFWNKFEYKVGRTGALKSWKAIKDMDQDLADKIIQGAENYANYRKTVLKPNNSTSKMAQGWLTDRRWEDELPKYTNGHSESSADFGEPETDHIVTKSYTGEAARELFK